MNKNETIIDLGAELLSAGEGNIAYRVRRGDALVPVTFADIARRMFAAYSRDCLAAVQDAGRIHAACVRAGCVHAVEAVCPGGQMPDECDHYQKADECANYHPCWARFASTPDGLTEVTK